MDIQEYISEMLAQGKSLDDVAQNIANALNQVKARQEQENKNAERKEFFVSTCGQAFSDLMNAFQATWPDVLPDELLGRKDEYKLLAEVVFDEAEKEFGALRQKGKDVKAIFDRDVSATFSGVAMKTPFTKSKEKTPEEIIAEFLNKNVR